MQDILLGTMAGLAAAMLAAMLYGLRRVNHALRLLRDDMKRTRRETEALFPQLQALMSLERTLALPRPLPALRGWAGSPDFLLSVADEILARGPRTVLECGSGVSTVVAARCAQLNGRGHVYSLDHDADYARQTRRLLERYNLAAWATVIDAPLTEWPDGSRWYAGNALPPGLRAIDLLVVDGPPGTLGSLARYPALPLLLPRMGDAFTVFIDDADRDDEREMVRRWRAEVSGLEESRPAAEKGLVVLRHGGDLAKRMRDPVVERDALTADS